MQRFKNLLTALLFIFLSGGSVLAQQKTVIGNVRDKVTHTNLAGVTVKSGARQTVTDKNGDFKLSADSSLVGHSKITFTYVGYREKKVVLTESRIYRVELEPSVAELAEVTINADAETIIKTVGLYASGNYNLRSSSTNQGLQLNSKKAYPFVG